jgi:hypothetical protein
MSDARSELRALIEGLVEDISELVKRAAVESVSDALGAAEGMSPAPSIAAAEPSRKGRRTTLPKPQQLPLRLEPEPAAAPSGKRSAEEIGSSMVQIVEYVRVNPGQGVEHIARGLGMETKELALPIKKLLATGKLKSTGQKRATKYFMGGKGRR